MHGNRVVVVGTSGSGKTRLAAALARRLCVRHIELDALYHGPGWTTAPEDEFVARVVEALDAEDDAGSDSDDGSGGWVADGNHAAVRPALLARATDVVWLDYPRPVVLWRVLRRSVARALLRRELWNGNTESWRAWLDPEHPVRWAWTSHPLRRREYEALAAGDPRWHRVHSPRQARRSLSR